MTFDLDKAKVIKVETDIEGIDSSLLNFQFRITINGVSYGFPGELTDGVLTIQVPPLKSVLNKAKSGQHSAVLEASSILEDGSGYYNQLQKGNVNLKMVPTVKVNIEPEELSVNAVRTAISSMVEENVTASIDVEPVPAPPETIASVDNVTASEPTDPWDALDQKSEKSKKQKKLLGFIPIK